MALNPQVARLLDKMPGNPFMDLEQIKDMTADKARALEVPADVVLTIDGLSIEEVETFSEGAEEPLRGRIYQPTSASPRGVLLWIRGGGFITGSHATDWISAPLAIASGCTVVSFEYRLAPEHPFPAGLEDSYAALLWTADLAAGMFGERSRLAIGGESAGGNLAAACTLLSRDRGGPRLDLQVLLYPMTARTFEARTRRECSMEFVARPEAIDWLWDLYLGGRSDPNGYASPLMAPDLTGLPPAVVITAEYDVLVDEGEEYARRLSAAGVPTSLRRYGGVPHGFVNFWGEVDVARECLDHMAVEIARCFDY